MISTSVFNDSIFLLESTFSMLSYFSICIRINYFFLPFWFYTQTNILFLTCWKLMFFSWIQIGTLPSVWICLLKVLQQVYSFFFYILCCVFLYQSFQFNIHTEYYTEITLRTKVNNNILFVLFCLISVSLCLFLS